MDDMEESTLPNEMRLHSWQLTRGGTAFFAVKEVTRD